MAYYIGNIRSDQINYVGNENNSQSCRPPQAALLWYETYLKVGTKQKSGRRDDHENTNAFSSQILRNCKNIIFSIISTNQLSQLLKLKSMKKKRGSSYNKSKLE